jgi:hypothetical protein
MEKTAKIKSDFKTEKALQQACVKWLRLQHPEMFFYHSPSEGRRGYKTVASLHSMGFKAGCPDLLIFYPHREYCGLAVELKQPRNQTTQAQDEFMEKLEEARWNVAVCKTLHEFVLEVEGYLK